MLRKNFFIIISLAMILIAAGASAYADELVKVNGKVLSKDNGSPLCAMVLANGQHIFSCSGDGGYELYVPLDGNGEITLFAFCAGLSPFSKVLKPEEAENYDIEMIREEAPAMSVTYNMIRLNSERVNISGTIRTTDGTPVCGMVLANGQNMFTCGENVGAYNLEVPSSYAVEF